MSVSTEVQRTLVKSPPELWAELGNVEGLSRHLGEVGEIRVTKVEPETRVEWEADLASGVVELKQSGWGTRVTLSLTRELPEAESEDSEEAGMEQPEAVAETGSKSAEAIEPAPVVDAEVTAIAAELEVIVVAPEPAECPEPPLVTTQPAPEAEFTAAPAEPKQGFFARLFKRRKRVEALAESQTEPIVQVQPDPEPAPPVELQAMALPEPVYPDPPPAPVEPEPSADLATELAELEAQLQQESTEFLTGVLDRLGAAHHRPFSRA
jgi:hypothetical protein